MSFSLVWWIVETLETLLRHTGGLLLLGMAVLLVVIYVRVRDRITAVERRLLQLERARQATPESAALTAPAPDTAGPSPTPVAAPSHAPPAPPGASPAPRRAVPSIPTPTAPVHRPAPARRVSPPSRLASSRAQPGFLAGLLQGGNWLVRGGVLVLFLGVGFLLKFAADHALLPVPLRLAAVGLGGIALVAVGMRLLASRRAYALALQGAGVGLVYLTLYAAFRLYALIPPGAAFTLMFAVVVAAGWLAVRQDAMALAVLGALGGFAAPLLASTGSGSHVMLFGYYAMLNAGVLGLSLLRAWRPLNLLGFVSTFGISALWGARFYAQEHFASVEPFLILFFLMYLAIAIAYALLRSIRLQDPMDAALVFGTPLVAFGLQSQLVAGTRYGLAISAMVLVVIYVAGAVVLMRRGARELVVLREAFQALAVGFFTLAIALAFDARWTSASWALEGAALVWVGWRQRRWLARLGGSALQVLAGGAWLWQAAGQTSWTDGDWLGTAMLAVAGLASGAMLARPPPTADHPEPTSWTRSLALLLGLWGLGWWLSGGCVQVAHLFDGDAVSGAMLLFFAGSALLWQWAGRWLRWSLLRSASTLLPVALSLHLLAVAGWETQSLARHGLEALLDTHPLSGLSAIGWPLALVSVFAVLRLEDQRRGPIQAAMHVLSLWLLAALVSWELAWCFEAWLPEIRSWRHLSWLLAPAAVLGLVTWAANRARAGGMWPLNGREVLYLGVGAVPLVAFSALAVMVLSLSDPGGPWPLPYLPVLNPLDLGMLAVMGSWLAWLRECRRRQDALSVAAVALTVVAFVWLNGSLLRSLHFWTDVPWLAYPMFRSTLVQASLSVLWASAGLLAMLGASRSGSRPVWITGAGLMVVVVAKLMLIDLASTATVARIVSFISVGLLLMLVGYLAPVPPRTREAGAGEA